jgi:hypothetical protein
VEDVAEVNWLRRLRDVVQFGIGLWMMFWGIIICALAIYGLSHLPPSHPCYPYAGETRACRR